MNTKGVEDVFHCACGGAMDYMNTCHSEEECVVEPSTPQSPTFSYQLAMYLTHNGGDAPHVQAKINRFLYDGKWKTTQGGCK
jgi:hypothetical protein